MGKGTEKSHLPDAKTIPKQARCKKVRNIPSTGKTQLTRALQVLAAPPGRCPVTPYIL